MKKSKNCGQTLVEYALILAFISVVAIVVIQAIHHTLPQNLQTKQVVNKISIIETEIRGWSETHFYAVAADGTVTKINMQTYLTLEKGQLVKGYWETK